MGCDIVVALGRATASGQTLFAQNSHRPAQEHQGLHRLVGRQHAAGETVQTSCLRLPEARQTFTVLGVQPANCWGLWQGVNEHQVAVGCAGWQSRLAVMEPTLCGADLVRLALERCRSARQAVDLVADLVARHGQTSAADGQAGDNVLVIADGREAFVVETAGRYWSALECGEVRAVCDAGMVRRDWSRLAHGLAEQVIANGWWPDDGSKLDFASLRAAPPDPTVMKRWSRATWLLEEQNGHIDGMFIRRVLGDHFEGTGSEMDPCESAATGVPALTARVVPLCRHDAGPAGFSTAASTLCQLSTDPDPVPVAWYAFGPPCVSIFFPIFLDGELPEAFGNGSAQANRGNICGQTRRLLSAMSGRPERWAILREELARLQARFDQEAEEFMVEAVALKRGGERDKFSRLAALLMESHCELFEAEAQRLCAAGRGEVAARAVRSVPSGLSSTT